MNAVEALDSALESIKLGFDLLKRMLEMEPAMKTKNRTVVVFTGYGLRLADYARALADEYEAGTIYIVGPDNNCAFDLDDRELDAVSYERHIREQDWAGEHSDRCVIADASQATSTTKGQATVAAKKIEERRIAEKRKPEDAEEILLVTAAYHHPRAYMTLLKALIKRNLQEQVRLIPGPYRLDGDRWDVADQDLKDKKTWSQAFAEDELPRIVEYQRKGDVASWAELKECLDRLV